jgi:hypothetical protein
MTRTLTILFTVFLFLALSSCGQNPGPINYYGYSVDNRDTCIVVHFAQSDAEVYKLEKVQSIVSRPFFMKNKIFRVVRFCGIDASYHKLI